jgi:hypothetical protein
MTIALPSLEAGLDAWRTFAVTHAADARTRRAVLASIDSMRDDDATDLLAALIPHTRGQGRLDVVERVARGAKERPPHGALVYVLVGELLASSGATRPGCIEALLGARDDEREAALLAVALAARIPGIRERSDRERSAWSALSQRASSDPLDGADPSDVMHACRRGGEGLGDVARVLDHALVLCTAGAPRATVTHLRTLAQHVIAARGTASPAAARTLAWLARASTRAESAPASVREAGWFATAVDALARTAIDVASFAPALRYAAESLGGDALDRAVAHAIVARVIVDARRASGPAATAIADTLESLLAALAATPHTVPSPRALAMHLLGRDANGSYVGVGRWLTDDLRARILETLLVHADLGARDLALADLERNGDIAALAPILRDIAASDADPVVRQHARQLARGERL